MSAPQRFCKNRRPMRPSGSAARVSSRSKVSAADITRGRSQRGNENSRAVFGPPLGVASDRRVASQPGAVGHSSRAASTLNSIGSILVPLGTRTDMCLPHSPPAAGNAFVFRVAACEDMQRQLRACAGGEAATRTNGKPFASSRTNTCSRAELQPDCLSSHQPGRLTGLC